MLTADKTYELDKIPIYTPYVLSYDRTKTKYGILESAAYLKRYYSMVDAEIYFCNRYVEDILTIDWDIQQQTMPLFGFNSYVYDAVAQGNRNVSGSFVINFTSPKYLFSLLESISEGEESFMSDYLPQSKTRSEVAVSPQMTLNPTYNRNLYNSQDKALWTKTFDIDAVFGYKRDTYIDPVHILISDVKITGSQIAMSADGGSRPNIFEIYTFTAKDIILDRFEEKAVKTPTVSSQINTEDRDTTTSNVSDDTPSWADFKKLNDDNSLDDVLSWAEFQKFNDDNSADDVPSWADFKKLNGK